MCLELNLARVWRVWRVLFLSLIHSLKYILLKYSVHTACSSDHAHFERDKAFFLLISSRERSGWSDQIDLVRSTIRCWLRKSNIFFLLKGFIKIITMY